MADSKSGHRMVRRANNVSCPWSPKQWVPIGNYSDRQLDRVRAYRILSHAEIESFVEMIVLDLVQREYSRWSSSKDPNYVMIYLLAASAFGWQDAEAASLDLGGVDPPTIKKGDDSIDQLMERAFDQYDDMVHKNNGIMSANLKRLLMPIGITMSDLDQTWLNSMNSFGAERGNVA